MSINRNNLIKELNNCKNIIDSANFPLWDELPRIDLYMDQVVMLLNDYLSYISEINPDEKNVTSSMINNYVKMKIIPAPNKKKYSRIHISRLIIICSLKQSLNISTVINLLPDSEDEQENARVYNAFVKSRREAVANNSILLEREFRAALNSEEGSAIDDMITRMAVTTDLHKMFTEKFTEIVYKKEEAEPPKKSEKEKHDKKETEKEKK